MKKSKAKRFKVVVFGGSGFLGSHVVDALTEKGSEVTIFDLKPSTSSRPSQRLVIGDIRDPQAVAKVLQGCDVVYHFAGFADLEEATRHSIQTVQQNIEGTVVILEAAAKAQVRRFVYASTIYVYSELGGFYRCSKQASELYIEEYQRRRHLDFTILRYGTLYGPRADQSNSLWRYLHQALEQGRIIFPGTGDETREYIHVRDAAKLSVDILSNEFRNQHVIITGHHPMKAKEMLNMVSEILHQKVKVEYQPGVPGAHYKLTPYSFMPKIGKKLVSNWYVDMGQGLLECLQEISGQIHGNRSRGKRR